MGCCGSKFPDINPPEFFSRAIITTRPPVEHETRNFEIKLFKSSKGKQIQPVPSCVINSGTVDLVFEALVDNARSQFAAGAPALWTELTAESFGGFDSDAPAATDPLSKRNYKSFLPNDLATFLKPGVQVDAKSDKSKVEKAIEELKSLSKSPSFAKSPAGGLNDKLKAALETLKGNKLDGGDLAKAIDAIKPYARSVATGLVAKINEINRANDIGAAPSITYSSIGNLERSSFLLDLIAIAADAAADTHPTPEEEWDDRTYSAPPPPDREVVGKAIDDTLKVWRGTSEADDRTFVSDRGALYSATVKALEKKGYSTTSKTFGGPPGETDYAGLKAALTKILPPVDYDFRQKITVMLGDQKAKQGKATNLEVTRDKESINTWNKQNAYKTTRPKNDDGEREGSEGVDAVMEEVAAAYADLEKEKFNPKKPMAKQSKRYKLAKIAFSTKHRQLHSLCEELGIEGLPALSKGGDPLEDTESVDASKMLSKRAKAMKVDYCIVLKFEVDIWARDYSKPMFREDALAKSASGYAHKKGKPLYWDLLDQHGNVDAARRSLQYVAPKKKETVTTPWGTTEAASRANRLADAWVAHHNKIDMVESYIENIQQAAVGGLGWCLTEEWRHVPETASPMEPIPPSRHAGTRVESTKDLSGVLMNYSQSDSKRELVDPGRTAAPATKAPEDAVKNPGFDGGDGEDLEVETTSFAEHDWVGKPLHDSCECEHCGDFILGVEGIDRENGFVGGAMSCVDCNVIVHTYCCHLVTECKSAGNKLKRTNSVLSMNEAVAADDDGDDNDGDDDAGVDDDDDDADDDADDDDDDDDDEVQVKEVFWYPASLAPQTVRTHIYENWLCGVPSNRIGVRLAPEPLLKPFTPYKWIWVKQHNRRLWYVERAEMHHPMFKKVVSRSYAEVFKQAGVAGILNKGFTKFQSTRPGGFTCNICDKYVKPTRIVTVSLDGKDKAGNAWMSLGEKAPKPFAGLSTGGSDVHERIERVCQGYFCHQREMTEENLRRNQRCFAVCMDCAQRNRVSDSDGMSKKARRASLVKKGSVKSAAAGAGGGTSSAVQPGVFNVSEGTELVAREQKFMKKWADQPGSDVIRPDGWGGVPDKYLALASSKHDESASMVNPHLLDGPVEAESATIGSFGPGTASARRHGYTDEGERKKMECFRENAKIRTYKDAVEKLCSEFTKAKNKKSADDVYKLLFIGLEAKDLKKAIEAKRSGLDLRYFAIQLASLMYGSKGTLDEWHDAAFEAYAQRSTDEEKAEGLHPSNNQTKKPTKPPVISGTQRRQALEKVLAKIKDEEDPLFGKDQHAINVINGCFQAPLQEVEIKFFGINEIDMLFQESVGPLLEISSLVDVVMAARADVLAFPTTMKDKYKRNSVCINSEEAIAHLQDCLEKAAGSGSGKKPVWAPPNIEEEAMSGKGGAELKFKALALKVVQLNLDDPANEDIKKFATVVESYYRTASQSYKAMLMFVKNVGFLTACASTDEILFTGMLTQQYKGEADDGTVTPDSPLAEVEAALVHNADQIELVVEGLKVALQSVGNEVTSMAAAVVKWRKAWVKKEVKSAKKKPEEIIPFLLGVIGADTGKEADITATLKKFYSEKAWKKKLTEVDLFNFVNRMTEFCLPHLGGSSFGEEQRRAMVAYYPNNLLDHLDYANCVVDEVNEIFANTYGSTNDATAALTELDLLMAELTHTCTFTVKGKEKIPNSIKECFKGLVKAVKEVNKKGRVYYVQSGTPEKPGYELAAMGKPTGGAFGALKKALGVQVKRIVLPSGVVAAVEDISQTMILKSRFQQALESFTVDINEADRTFYEAWGAGSSATAGAKTEMATQLEGHPEESSAKSAAKGNVKNVKKLLKVLNKSKKKSQLLKESDRWVNKAFKKAKNKGGDDPQSIKGFMRDVMAARKIKDIASTVMATLFADAPEDKAKETQKTIKDATKWLEGELEAAGHDLKKQIKDPAARKRFVVWVAQLALVQYKTDLEKYFTGAAPASDFNKAKVERNTDSAKAVLEKITAKVDDTAAKQADAKVKVVVADESNRAYLESVFDRAWAGFAPFYDLGGYDDYPTLQLSGHPLIDIQVSECVVPFAQITKSLGKVNEAIDAFIGAAAALQVSIPGKKKGTTVVMGVFDVDTATEAICAKLSETYGPAGAKIRIETCTKAEKAEFAADAKVLAALQKYVEYHVAMETYFPTMEEQIKSLKKKCESMEGFCDNDKLFAETIMSMPLEMLKRPVPDNNVLCPFPNVRAPSRMGPAALDILLPAPDKNAYVALFVKESLASAYKGKCGEYMKTVDLENVGNVEMDTSIAGSAGAIFKAIGVQIKAQALEVAIDVLAMGNPVTGAIQGIRWAFKLVKFAALAGIDINTAMIARAGKQKERASKTMLGKETIARSNNNVRSLNEYINGIMSLIYGLKIIQLGAQKELSAKGLIKVLNQDEAADVSLKLWTPSP